MTPSPAETPGHAAPNARLRELLYTTFRGSPTPVLLSESFGIPGASLWSGARLWINRFRELGLAPGDRVVLALSPRPAQVMATIAAWWEGLTLCTIPGNGAASPKSGRAPASRLQCVAALARWNASLCIASDPGWHTLSPVHDDIPNPHPLTRRKAWSPTPHIALIAPREEGSTLDAAVSWSSLTGALLASPARCAGAEPWHAPTCWSSARTLITELWPALLAGATVYADAPPAKAAPRRRAA